MDFYGRELVDLVISKEAERADNSTDASYDEFVDEPSSAKILRPASAKLRYLATSPKYSGKRSIPLYELPVSAGAGVYLEAESTESIRIPNTEKTADADFVLRISGNSMAPKYNNGDYLLVKREDSIEEGELGIFLLDGCGFFKVYGGDRLISLNPEYAPILFKDFSDVQCKGRVIGRLRRK